jgi:hypothetical protein
MYLFSRTAVLAGSPRQTAAWVAEVTTTARELSDLPVTAWAAWFGRPVGTHVWTVPVESHAALDAMSRALLGDGAYLDVVERGRPLVVAPAEDVLREILLGTAGDPPPLGAVATITEADAVVDRMGEAVAWAMDMAEHVRQVIDVPVSLSTPVYGQMGRLTWIGVQPDAAAIDASSGKIRSDAGYLSRLTATGDLFLPGSGRTALFTRVA